MIRILNRKAYFSSSLEKFIFYNINIKKNDMQIKNKFYYFLICKIRKYAISCVFRKLERMGAEFLASNKEYALFRKLIFRKRHTQ